MLRIFHFYIDHKLYTTVNQLSRLSLARLMYYSISAGCLSGGDDHVIRKRSFYEEDPVGDMSCVVRCDF